jgi:hypothetical protein
MISIILHRSAQGSSRQQKKLRSKEFVFVDGEDDHTHRHALNKILHGVVCVCVYEYIHVVAQKGKALAPSIFLTEVQMICLMMLIHTRRINYLWIQK